MNQSSLLLQVTIVLFFNNDELALNILLHFEFILQKATEYISHNPIIFITDEFHVVGGYVDDNYSKTIGHLDATTLTWTKAGDLLTVILTDLICLFLLVLVLSKPKNVWLQTVKLPVQSKIFPLKTTETILNSSLFLLITVKTRMYCCLLRAISYEFISQKEFNFDSKPSAINSGLLNSFFDRGNFRSNTLTTFDFFWIEDLVLNSVSLHKTQNLAKK